MDKRKVVIIGASGHARSVIDLLLDQHDIEIVGCVDKGGVSGQPLEGLEEVKVLGDDNILEELYSSGIQHAFVAIGSNSLRKKIIENLSSIGFTLISVISKHAIISKKATIGPGTCIMAGAVININAVIGTGCIINTNTSIDHDCSIGDFAHIAPGTAISGSTVIDEGVFIGTNSSVIDGICIGKWACIGAGAAVVKNIPEHVLACGVPAKIKKNLI